ncbi:MAG TPA: cupredoxin domain-containing protein [Solirubrobacteraceae bacterium]|nr:cupredoxin domain-containing protein [Solirubrobacteraceae bacterium]
MKRSPHAALTACVVLLGTAGCGATTSAGAGRTLRIALSEYRVIPQDVQAPAGSLTISVHNYGRLSHSLVISRGGVADASTVAIAPGQSTLLEAVLSPGQYQMASSVLSDQALGTYGTLDVRSGTGSH